MSKKDIQKVRALVQNATLPEREVKLCLRGDIQLKIEGLEQELIDMRADDDNMRSLGERPESLPIVEQIEALIAEAEDSTIDVLMRAVSHLEWDDLVAKHPSDDENLLYDEGLYRVAVPMCWAEPELDRETLDKLIAKLTKGQWELLTGTVAVLNRGDRQVPFSALASRIRKTSGEPLKSLAPEA